MIYYNLLEQIKDRLATDTNVNTVTQGDIFDIDLAKQTIFPLSHIIVNQADYEGNTWRCNVSVLCMDIVDKDSDSTTDVFIGNDNEQDVLNTQLAVINRMLEVFRRGEAYDFVLEGNVTVEPFTERFENYLAGWTATFDIIVPNTMTKCEIGISPTTTDVTVENSDQSYYMVVNAGDTLELEDTTYEVYVNGSLDSTATEPSIKATTINISV